jgi:transposase
MPVDLRARLRRFADARHLGASEALRLIVSDLTAIEEELELDLAERWQLTQADKPFQDDLAGTVKTVPGSDIETRFADARAKRPPR